MKNTVLNIVNIKIKHRLMGRRILIKTVPFGLNCNFVENYFAVILLAALLSAT